MEIKNHNLTIVGSFNTAIINPQWLQKQKIYDSEIIVEFNQISVGFRYLMKNIGVYWEISPNKLLLYRTNPLEELDEDSLKFVKEIFNKLSYTPVQAIGYNLHIIPDEEKKKSISQLINSIKENNLSLYNKDSIYFSISNKFKWKDHTVLIINEIDNNQVSVHINIEKILSDENMSKEISQFINNIKEIHKYGCSLA